MMIFFYVFTFINTNVKWSSLGNTKTAQLFGYLQSVQQRIPAIKTTKGKKIRTFLTHVQRVFSPNAFGILTGKVNRKASQN